MKIQLKGKEVTKTKNGNKSIYRVQERNHPAAFMERLRQQRRHRAAARSNRKRDQGEKVEQIKILEQLKVRRTRATLKRKSWTMRGRVQRERSGRFEW